MLVFRALFAGAAVLLASGAASATTIDFSGMPLGIAFSSYSENGFTVTAQSGAWFDAFVIGDPAPAINAVSRTATVTITSDAHQAFTFVQADLKYLLPRLFPNGSYSFTGTLGGTTVFSQSGGQDAGHAFNTYTNLFAADAIDTLAITITNPGLLQAVYLDNIVVNAAVPEPATIGVLGFGLAGLLASRRRRHA